MRGLQLYFRYASISLRGQLQYRASFAMQVIGQFVLSLIEFIGVWALFDRFGLVEGWALPQVALLYGTITVTWSIAESTARGFDLFGNTVKAGDFDRLLLRPRSTVLQLQWQELTLRRAGKFVLGLLITAYAVSALHLEWSPQRVALLATTVVCGVCLFWGLLVLQATSAFWTTESLEVWNAFTYGGIFMSQYPLAIYRPWFRKFFTFVIPLACINYFPGVALLDMHDPLGTTRPFQCLAPLAGPLFLVVALQIWKVGVRHYRSTGS